MKKILIIVIVMLSLVLAGCGKKDNPVEDSSSNQSEAVEESTAETDETTPTENADEDIANASDITEAVVEEVPVVDMSPTTTSEDFDAELIQFSFIDYDYPELSKYYGFVVVTAKEGADDSSILVTLEGTKDDGTSYTNDDVIDPIGNGSTSYVAFSFREPYKNLKCTIEPVEKSLTSSVSQNISHEEVIVDGGAEVTITNNGDVSTTPVNCTTLFYKGETVVDMVNGFSAFDDLGDGIKGLAPHTSKTLKEKTEKEFDRIKVFIKADLLEE